MTASIEEKQNERFQRRLSPIYPLVPKRPNVFLKKKKDVRLDAVYAPVSLWDLSIPIHLVLRPKTYCFRPSLSLSLLIRPSFVVSLTITFVRDSFPEGFPSK